jgi:ketosteroid isomerase-like protein
VPRTTAEIVKSAADAFNRGDAEAFVALAHPDIEWDAGVLGTPTYRGRDGLRRLFRDVEAAWGEMQVDVDLLAESEDAVVLACRFRARGRTTGAPVEATQFCAVEFAEGLARRGCMLFSEQEARDAVGLSD